MKKIAIDISVLNDAQKTGIGVYVFNLIDNLLKINKTDQFILFGIATWETSSRLKNLPFKNYSNVELKIYQMPARLFRTVFLIWQKINWPFIEYLVGEVDIFHSFNWFLPPTKKAVVTTKVVAAIFDLTSINNPLWHAEKTVQLDKIRLEKIKKYATVITTISENSKKDLLTEKVKQKIEVIYPAVKPIKDSRKSMINGEYILSVATIEPRKNLKFLVESYLEGGFKQKLVLVGKIGWKNKDLLEIIEKNRQKIVLTGFVSDQELKGLYQKALFFVYPSLYEGFGIPVLEAMANGAPVISSNTSSLPEVGGKAVLYIDPKNKKTLINAMKKLLTDKKLRNDLIKKGKIQSKKFSWVNSAKKLNDIYQRI